MAPIAVVVKHGLGFGRRIAPRQQIEGGRKDQDHLPAGALFGIVNCSQYRRAWIAAHVGIDAVGHEGREDVGQAFAVWYSRMKWSLGTLVCE